MLGSTSTGPYFAAYALALAGTALKIYQWYHSRPLWLDEQMVLLNVRDRMFSELIGTLWLNQVAPLGWLALQHNVISAFGTGDRAMRGVPVLFGIATLWAGCWVARRWMNPVAAAVFVTLCAIGQWITFYALEAKPYSADAFWALMLPALAVWAAEPAGGHQRLSLKRTAIWWSAAAAGQWFSFGATFVTPACALVLCAVAWRRLGARSVGIFVLQGVVWLICFAAHYELSMAAASSDQFLQTYWAAGFLPPGSSPAGALQWFGERAESLAAHPGGAAGWALFWVAVLYGLSVLLLDRPVMGLVMLSVPLSAILLAILRLAPLADRLAFWTTPATYVAISVAAGHIFSRLHSAPVRRRYVVLAVAMLFSTAAFVVSAEIASLGRERIIIRGDNHGLDDGRAMRLLMHHREAGDVFLTTHFGLPALWWYGNVDIGDDAGGSRLIDGAPIFEIRHVWRGLHGCQNSTRLKALAHALTDASRAAVYLGFGSDVPPGFNQMVLDDLGELGTRTFYNVVGSEGVAAIYDLRLGPQVDLPPQGAEEGKRAEGLSGCVGVQPAQRW